MPAPSPSGAALRADLEFVSRSACQRMRKPSMSEVALLVRAGASEARRVSLRLFPRWQVSASVSSGDSSQVARDSPNTKMLTTAAWGVCKELAKTSEKAEELLVLGIEDARRSSRSQGCSMFSPSTRLAACLCLCRFAERTSATSDSSHEGRSGGRRPLLPSRVRTGVQQASEGA